MFLESVCATHLFRFQCFANEQDYKKYQVYIQYTQSQSKEK